MTIDELREILQKKAELAAPKKVLSNPDHFNKAVKALETKVEEDTKAAESSEAAANVEFEKRVLAAIKSLKSRKPTGFMKALGIITEDSQDEKVVEEPAE